MQVQASKENTQMVVQNIGLELLALTYGGKLPSFGCLRDNPTKVVYSR
jgi:hypothetical protein